MQTRELIKKETAPNECTKIMVGVTGNTHYIPSEVKTFNSKDGSLCVEKDTVLKHTDTHAPLKVPKGKYKVSGLAEFDYAQQRARRLAD